MEFLCKVEEVCWKYVTLKAQEKFFLVEIVGVVAEKVWEEFVPLGVAEVGEEFEAVEIVVMVVGK